MTYITKYISTYINPDDTVLDLCCGPCNPTREIKASVKVGVDLNRIALVEAGKHCIPVCMDVARIGEFFMPKSFDVVLWLDGIEHLEEMAAMKSLLWAEEIAKREIIVFTPNQKAFFDLKDEYLRHKSFWPEEIWRKRGYEVQVGFRSAYKGTIVDMVLARKKA
jgi:hypothetical protein